MSGPGPVGPSSNPNKIKGGRWTVAKFFCISLAYTVVWMTLSSELGYYKILYGPQVLLQMNIAYFLPSIPLLAISSLCDDWLDQHFGVAKTILGRLLVGLGGCALVCAVFPFTPQNPKWLLGSIVVLGLVHGVAFSASYQMVSRFANKNTISLGLGCVGSGLLVLFIEVAMQLGPKPSRTASIILFETVAGVVVLGFVAAISLLLRHWQSIERYNQPASVTQPLLQQQEEGRLGAEPERGLEKHASYRMLGFTPLGFFDTISEGDTMIEGAMTLPSGRPVIRHPSFQLDRITEDYVSPAPHPLRRSATLPVQSSGPGNGPLSPGQAQAQAPLRSKPGGSSKGVGDSWQAGIGTIVESSEHSASSTSPSTRSAFSPQVGQDQDRTAPPEPSQQRPGQAQLARSNSGAALVWEVMRGIWPVMLALLLAGLVMVLIFPFFTYCPTSGWLGDMLPKVLFFSSIFANLFGRLLPKFKSLSVRSPLFLLALAVAQAAVSPIAFVYFKSGPSWHSDLAAIGCVVALWAAGGYINTNAYVVAPQCVPSHLKASAAGLMAMTSQLSHTAGLLVAVVLAEVLFGGIALV